VEVRVRSLQFMCIAISKRKAKIERLKGGRNLPFT
jgi:hypothetical protein